MIGQSHVHEQQDDRQFTVEALSELRAAVPSLQAIPDRAFALAAATEFEGRRRNIERVGIRAVDLITAISGLA